MNVGRLAAEGFFFLPRVKTDYSPMLSSTSVESLRGKKNARGHISNSVKKREQMRVKSRHSEGLFDSVFFF